MYFTTDTVADAVTLDEGESSEFTLDEATITTIDNPPWERAFDTDRFYKFDTVVARPIEQTYIIDGEEYTFKKTAEALERAAWSLDNNPYPLTHPDTRVVTDMDDVHGFHRRPRYETDYDETGDALLTSLYVPVSDDSATEFISDHRAVSVGVYNDLEWDTDEESVDAYQIDLYFDHVAGVRKGRCSVEDGCGITTDSDITVIDEDGNSAVLQPTDDVDNDSFTVYSTVKWTEDGDWRHGRIAAESIENDESLDSYEIECYDYDNETFDESTVIDGEVDLSSWVGPDADSCEGDSCSCGCHTDQQNDNTIMDDDDSDINFDSIVGGMTVDAVAEHNEHVAELTEDKQDAEDRVDVLEDKVETLEADLDSAREKLEEFENGERDPKSAIVDDITDLTSAWDEDELMDLDHDTLERRKEVAEDAASSPSTPDKGTDDESIGADETPTTDSADDGRTVSDEYRSWG